MMIKKRVDAHLDLAFDVERQRAYGKRKVLETQYLDSLRRGNVGILVSSVFVENMFIPEMALRVALRQVAALKADIGECGEHFAFCVTMAEADGAIEAGKIAILLSLEDCIPIYNDLPLLDIFYDLGVRMVGLSWSRRNWACDGAAFTPQETGAQGGLTEFGIRLVKRCEERKLLIDVSHINERGFYDVVNTAKKPFIASHSNARHFVNSERNLSDQQIRIIAERGGVIGVNAMNFVNCNTDAEESLERVADHIEYMAELGGIGCVGLGFDLNDQILKYIPQDELALIARPCRDLIKGHGEIPKLLAVLGDRGFSEEEIQCIGGENFRRVYREVMD